MDKARTYNIFTSPADISKIIDLALKHLPPLGFECKLSFERTGKWTFDSEIIGAVANGLDHRITVNLDWYETTNWIMPKKVDRKSKRIIGQIGRQAIIMRMRAERVIKAMDILKNRKF